MEVSELYEVFVGSKEDIERERMRREEQMRIDFLNNLKEDEENREQIEKINREIGTTFKYCVWGWHQENSIIVADLQKSLKCTRNYGKNAFKALFFKKDC